MRSLSALVQKLLDIERPCFAIDEFDICSVIVENGRPMYRNPLEWALLNLPLGNTGVRNLTCVEGWSFAVTKNVRLYSLPILFLVYRSRCLHVLNVIRLRVVPYWPYFSLFCSAPNPFEVTFRRLETVKDITHVLWCVFHIKVEHTMFIDKKIVSPYWRENSDEKL